MPHESSKMNVCAIELELVLEFWETGGNGIGGEAGQAPVDKDPDVGGVVGQLNVGMVVRRICFCGIELFL